MRAEFGLMLYPVVSVTVTGILMTIVLAMPQLGLGASGTIGWTLGGGMIASLPLSYLVSVLILKRWKR